MQRFVRKGDVAFDIGANIGLHSILLSGQVGPEGKLCVFEPNVELLSALRHTVRKLDNATLYAFALSNKNGSSTLFVPSDHTTASLADWTGSSPVFKDDGPSHVVTCDERRIDDLIEEHILPPPDFIKCDVEGAELLVFEGARQTLNRVDAPIILFEANECASSAFNLDVAAAKDFLAGLDAPALLLFRNYEATRIEKPASNKQELSKHTRNSGVETFQLAGIGRGARRKFRDGVKQLQTREMGLALYKG